MKHSTYRPGFGVVRGLCLVVIGGVAACSTSPGTGETNAANAAPAEAAKASVEVVESAITSGCRLSTIGLPCDPDGSSGAASECEGVCWIDDAALVTCMPVADVNMITTDLNGRICGDVEGRDCSRSCENGNCVDKNARLGTACRPTNNSTSCDGVCTLIGGTPACDAVTVCDDVRIADDGCALRACNFNEYEGNMCQIIELDNAVCEASMLPPVIEAGVSSEPGDAAVPADGGDAAAVPGETSSDEVSDAAASEPEPGETTTDGARDAATPTEGTSSASSGAVDAGGDASVPVGVYANRPTKVIGGACSAAPNGGSTSGFGAVLAALGVVAFRRARRR